MKNKKKSKKFYYRLLKFKLHLDRNNILIIHCLIQGSASNEKLTQKC